MATVISFGDVRADRNNPNRKEAVQRALDAYEGKKTQAVKQVTVPPEAADQIAPARKNPVASAALARKKRLDLKLGIETYNYKYKETVDGQGFASINGHFKGIFASMVYRPLTPDYFLSAYVDHLILEGRMAWGQVEYDGGFQGLDGPLVSNNIPDIVTEWRGMAARDLDFFGMTFTPYTGFGYRYLNDKQDKAMSSWTFEGNTFLFPEGAGSKRISRYYYLPIGMDIAKGLPHDWRIGLNGELDVLLWGQQQTFFETDISTRDTDCAEACNWRGIFIITHFHWNRTSGIGILRIRILNRLKYVWTVCHVTEQSSLLTRLKKSA
ncbi:MAG: hypothetical protein HQK55_17435 [Deltaproteobacteria bacterium]|nr:hypothetical protein [Deltaproteobacteria bacterium]